MTVSRVADCHPDRPHFGRGLCKACHSREWQHAIAADPEFRRHRAEMQARYRASAKGRETKGRTRTSTAGREAKRSHRAGRRRVEVVGRLDGWLCGICGLPVLPEPRWSGDQSGVIDHVVPRSHGGTDDLSNVQIAHHGCNRRKGSRHDVLAMAALRIIA